ncbi:metallophosphoesterase [Paenibacillus brevis]|uniref:Metallophosphoesterase n=1 Tax=Paenibacillus brevis TaxID=2841508 RepID=A0ABS6FQD9_9BACL|nr:metallophosphoesterase [Paenibacillus brevis]MBU5672146.1 metallophosphoesterase [Paenibacillus brevis]
MLLLVGIGFLIVYALLVFYIGWSGWSWMKPAVSARFRLAYITIVIVLAVSFIIGQLFGGISVMSIIGSYWIAVFSLLLLMLPIVHLSLWLLRLTRLPRHRTQKWAGSLTLVALMLLMAFGSFNAYSPTVRHYDIHIDKHVPGLDRLHVVMAADMHFGHLSGAAHAKRLVEQINALEPDIVLYPGDIIDNHLDVYTNKGIGSIIRGVNATYGVYASLGNHDKYKGGAPALIKTLEESGMRVLYDEVLSVNGVTIIGRMDHTDHDRAEFAVLMNGVDHSSPVFLLEHQPYDLDVAAEAGVDLMVSGHTHRGQIAPANLITSAIYENDWGHLQKGTFHSIVTSGFGFWGPPIRIGSRSEVVSITITFAPSPPGV